MARITIEDLAAGTEISEETMRRIHAGSPTHQGALDAFDRASLESVSDMSRMMFLRLQLRMETRSRMLRIMSGMLKTMSQTAAEIVSDVK